MAGVHLRIFWSVFLICVQSDSGFSTWWSLTQINVSLGIEIRPQTLCGQIPNLHPKQKRLCRRRIEVVAIMSTAMKAAIEECQYHFRYHKWNCSTFERDYTVFGKNFLRDGTSELAFVQALTTGSAVIQISKSCSSGSPFCGCSLKTVEKDAISNRMKFKSRGCIESTKFALHFVRRFVDAGEDELRDPLAKITVYNNKAGRRGVLEKSKSCCKCHGISGSCTMQTCWRSLPTLRQLGLVLKDKYDSAIKVDFNSRGRLVTVDHLQSLPTKADLIYFEDSPDGCILDNSRGRLGTEGRLCNSTSDGMDSCDILCCERNHETKRVSVTRECECTFRWCCDVKCNLCHHLVPTSRCKKRISEDAMELENWHSLVSKKQGSTQRSEKVTMNMRQGEDWRHLVAWTANESIGRNRNAMTRKGQGISTAYNKSIDTHHILNQQASSAASSGSRRNRNSFKNLW